MDAFIWILLPLVTAVGSALLAFYVMQARLEVVVAKEREALVEARAMMKNHARELEDRIKAAEEEARRRSLDDLLADIHVEERHYMRENKSLFSNTKSMVLQERLYFRNLPLSNWVEHELTVEHGQTADLANLARAASVFAAQGQAALGQADAAFAAQSAALARVESGTPSALTPQAPVSTSPRATPAPFGAAGNGFGARRGSAAPNAQVARVANIASIDSANDTAMEPAGERPRVSFSPRFSQSRLARG